MLAEDAFHRGLLVRKAAKLRRSAGGRNPVPRTDRWVTEVLISGRGVVPTDPRLSAFGVLAFGTPAGTFLSSTPSVSLPTGYRVAARDPRSSSPAPDFERPVQPCAKPRTVARLSFDTRRLVVFPYAISRSHQLTMSGENILVTLFPNSPSES